VTANIGVYDNFPFYNQILSFEYRNGLYVKIIIVFLTHPKPCKQGFALSTSREWGRVSEAYPGWSKVKKSINRNFVVHRKTSGFLLLTTILKIKNNTKKYKTYLQS